jgi:hypothetical protein
MDENKPLTNPAGAADLPGLPGLPVNHIFFRIGRGIRHAGQVGPGGQQ